MVKAVLVGALVTLGLAGVLMLLWNWLVPLLLGGPPVSFWQTLGLLVLIRLLFGSRRHWGSRHPCIWKKKFEAEWSKMTSEEQARFKHNFTRHCHRWRWSEPEDEPNKANAE